MKTTLTILLASFLAVAAYAGCGSCEGGHCDDKAAECGDKSDKSDCGDKKDCGDKAEKAATKPSACCPAKSVES